MGLGKRFMYTILMLGLRESVRYATTAGRVQEQSLCIVARRPACHVGARGKNKATSAANNAVATSGITSMLEEEQQQCTSRSFCSSSLGENAYDSSAACPAYSEDVANV
eukprot:5848-Heterococcus_DN1.PRE.1